MSNSFPVDVTPFWTRSTATVQTAQDAWLEGCPDGESRAAIVYCHGSVRRIRTVDPILWFSRFDRNAIAAIIATTYDREWIQKTIDILAPGSPDLSLFGGPSILYSMPDAMETLRFMVNAKNRLMQLKGN